MTGDDGRLPPIRLTLRDMISRILAWVRRRMPTLLVLILLILLPNSYIFEFESSVYDVHMKMRYLANASNVGDKSFSDDVVVILVDDEALRTDEERLLVGAPPVSRRYLGRLIKDMVAARPKAIVLDFFLDRPGEQVSDDQNLMDALSKVQAAGIEVVLTTRFSKGNERWNPLVPAPLFLKPLDQASLFLGHANVEKSTIDSVVRRIAAGRKLSFEQKEHLVEHRRELAHANMYFGNNSVYSLSLPLQLLRSIEPGLQGHENAAIDSVLKGKPLNILFAEGTDHIKVISSAHVSNRKVLSKISNQIVIIGSGFSESSDWHLTPLSTTTFASTVFGGLSPVSGAMEGAVLVAYSFITLREALLYSRQIVTIPEWCVNVFMLLFGSGLLITLRRIGRMRTVGPALVIVALFYWVGNIVLFQKWLVSLPMIGPSAVLLGIYLVAYFMERLETESSINRSKPEVEEA